MDKTTDCNSADAQVKRVLAETISDGTFAANVYEQYINAIEANPNWTFVEAIYYIMALNDLPQQTRHALRKLVGVDKEPRKTKVDKMVKLSDVILVLATTSANEKTTEQLVSDIVFSSLQKIAEVDLLFRYPVRKFSMWFIRRLYVYGVIHKIARSILRRTVSLYMDGVRNAAYGDY